MPKKMTPAQKVMLRRKIEKFAVMQSLYGMSLAHGAKPLSQPELEEWYESRRDLLAYVGLTLEADEEERKAR